MDFSAGETQVSDTSLDFSIGEIQTGAKHIDLSNAEIRILGDCLDFSNGEIQTGPKIRISPLEKSIYACIYAHIWVIQMCACVQTEMDFSNIEIKVFETSPDFYIGEIQTCSTNMDFSNGEIRILSDCLDFASGGIQTGSKNTNFSIGEIHICMQIHTHLCYPNLCMRGSRYGFL